MEAYQKHKRLLSGLSNAVARELADFEEELESHENAFDMERKALRREIGTLRQESSRAKNLEDENENLRSKLDHAVKYPKQYPTTSSAFKALNSGYSAGIPENEHTKVLEELKILKENHGILEEDHRILKEDHGILEVDHRILEEDHRVLKEDHGILEEDHRILKEDHGILEEEHRILKEDYGKLVASHGILKEAHRAAREINEKWKVFYRQHIHRSKNDRSAAITNPISLDVSNPTDIRETTILPLPYPTSLNYDSRSSSASNADLKVLPQNGSVNLGGSSQDNHSSRRDSFPARDIFDIPPDSEPENLTETYENNLISDLPQTDPRVDTATQDVKPPVGSLDDDSDSPVFVSERFLKRKRGSVPKLNNRRGQHVSAGSDGVQNPIQIKSDPASSPMVPISYLVATGPQDSVDLDEVGEKRFTPRKRRRLASEMWDRHSGDGTLEGAEYDKIMQYYDSDDRSAKTSNDRILDDETNGVTDHFLARDKDYFMKQVEDYGVDRWEQEHRDVARHGELNAQAPGRLRGRRQGMVARDYVYDKEAHDRAKQKVLNSGSAKGVHSRSDTAKTSSSSTTFKLQAPENEHRLPTSSMGNYLQQSPFSPQMLEIQPDILRPTDPNALLLPRTSESSMNRKLALPPSRRDQASARFGFLTEDGEEFSGAGSSSKAIGLNQTDFKNALYKASKAPDSHRRLGALMTSCPRKGAVLSNILNANRAKPVTPTAMPPRPTLRQMYGKDPMTPLNKIARTSELGISRVGKHTRPNSRSRTEPRPTSSGLSRTGEPNEVLPAHEPLRIRPLGTLCPSDFKLNPAHNGGYDHPFSEVVRNRDLRKCMPGCTRPGCCGSTLRKAVEIGGFAAPRTSGLLNSSPSDEWEADQRLLKEYLGDYDYTLLDMPDQERNELLLQAKTERFANVHGKHRYEFGRAPSPPGFWEPDMPTTQQEMENRAAAMVLEKEKVAEMYKEAMRPDGRYKFRDE